MFPSNWLMRMTIFAAIVPIDSNGTFAQDQVEQKNSSSFSFGLSTWTDVFSLKLRQQLPGKCDFDFDSFIFYLFTYLYIGSSY